MGELIEVVGGGTIIVVVSVFSVIWFTRARTRWQGLIRGAIAGGVLGLVVAATIGLTFTLLRPDDPSAGSEAIIGIMTFPVGLILGAIGGVLKPPRMLASEGD